MQPRFGREMSCGEYNASTKDAWRMLSAADAAAASLSTASSPRSPQAQDSTRASQREQFEETSQKLPRDPHFATYSPVRTAANINHYDNKMLLLLLLHPKRRRPAWPTTSPLQGVVRDVCAVVSLRCRREKKRDDRKPDQKRNCLNRLDFQE